MNSVFDQWITENKISLRNSYLKSFEIAYSMAVASAGVGGRNHNGVRVGAALLHKNRVVSARFNSRKTHPRLAGIYKYPYLHAEASCIIHAGIDNCRNLIMFVVRIGRDGKIMASIPCPDCLELISYAGIKTVFYSDVDKYGTLDMAVF
jgi:deoxycytidylate deaminase